MRVVGGTARGTHLLSVPGDTTRPILDRVKTALFDILRPRIEGLRVLDAFAGSGSVGIEALSQGAAHCIFLDLARAAVETIRKNVASTHFEKQAEIRQTDAFSFIKNTSKSFDLIYIAPPQYKGIWEEFVRAIAERPDLVTDNGLVIVQIDPKEYTSLALETFAETRRAKYGSTVLIFFEKV